MCVLAYYYYTLYMMIFRFVISVHRWVVTQTQPADGSTLVERDQCHSGGTGSQEAMKAPGRLLSCRVHSGKVGLNYCGIAGWLVGVYILATSKVIP